MIGHLRGMLLEKTPTGVIVEAGGVGYEVTIPISTFTALPKESREISLRIHTQVREDAIALFGFATAEEKRIFERLISVNGIGPKLAITILSGLATEDLVGAIRGGDVQRLVRIPGIGKKTAERMILELRDKLATGDASATNTAVASGSETVSMSHLERDVLSALQNLGCTRQSAEEAIRKAKERGAPEEFEPFFRTAMALVR